jgi:hypothetical protein
MCARHKLCGLRNRGPTWVPYTFAFSTYKWYPYIGPKDSPEPVPIGQEVLRSTWACLLQHTDRMGLQGITVSAIQITEPASGSPFWEFCHEYICCVFCVCTEDTTGLWLQRSSTSQHQPYQQREETPGLPGKDRQGTNLPAHLADLPVHGGTTLRIFGRLVHFGSVHWVY